MAKHRSAILQSRLLSKIPALVHGVYPRHRRLQLSDLVRPQVDEQLVQAFGIQASDLVFAQQVHGAKVHSPKHGQAAQPGTDGFVTSAPGLMLAIHTADCVPVLLFDPSTRTVGAAHAGWRGILNGVIEQTIRTMKTSGADPGRIIAWLGPAVHSCCYDITDAPDQRRRRFMKRFGQDVVIERKGRTYLDLQNAIVQILRRAGVQSRYIEISDACTAHDQLPSHIRERSRRQETLVAVIGLRDPIDRLHQKRVLVLGLGHHGGGVATTKWLAGQGARLRVTDVRSRAALSASLQQLRGVRAKYILGKHRVEDIDWAEIIVVSPGVPNDSPFLRRARHQDERIINDAVLFFRYCPAPIIGITGTKGKTSTATYISHLLKKSGFPVITVGHGQVALLHELDRIKKNTKVVAELSSWRLEYLAARHQSPHISVITNIMPDHLNRYHGMREYVQAKQIITSSQQPTDIAVLNRDNAYCRQIGRTVPEQRWWFTEHTLGQEHGIHVQKNFVSLRQSNRSTAICSYESLKHLPVPTPNVMAAILAAWHAGATLSAIRRALPTLPPIPHRFETVARLGGITFINDSAATTPEAAIAAIQRVRGRFIFIGGGADKQLRYATLGRLVRKRAAHAILFDGAATKKLVPSLPRAMVTVVRDMKTAVSIAVERSKPGTTVLLSPGAASFGIFQHEFDRGDQFRRAVQQIRP